MHFSALIKQALLVVVISLCSFSFPAHAQAATNWFNNDWMYRMPIEVQNPNATPLTDYQAQITLDNATFPFAEALPNGADLRFMDAATNTIYPHWIEKYDQIGKTALIWVRIPAIAANSTINLQLYYGNSLAPQASNGADTFSFFDDFDDGDITDWSHHITSPGPYFTRGTPLFVEGGQVVIREGMNSPAYIKKSFTGSLQGKVVESLLEYGHPSFMDDSVGADAHPRLTVIDALSTKQAGVGPVQVPAFGNLPANNFLFWADAFGDYVAGAFNYNLGDRVVNRLSFIDADNIQFSVRAESDTVWGAEKDFSYTTGSLDNGFITLGKLPLEDFDFGGPTGTHQWDWVRVRTYADQETTFSTGETEAETLLTQLQISSSLPGQQKTKYTFSITPNQPIPNGGSINIEFPVAFEGHLDNITPTSIVVTPHAQITSQTVQITPATRSVQLTLTSTVDITDPIVITIGDGAGIQGDIRNPVTSGPHALSITSLNVANDPLAQSTVQMSTSSWWNADWSYRSSLHVNNVKVRSDLNDYQIQLDLTAANFNFTHAKANGEDLRFILPNGTVLPYWIEYYDQVNELARVWIKVPQLPANTEIMLFTYFGNPTAPSVADGNTVFRFFDDFADADISDWSTYSASPGAITVTPGEVEINEIRDNRAYLRKPYAGTLDNIALEGVVRYLDPGIGESFHPHIGFYTSDDDFVSFGPVEFGAGGLPTDHLRYWASSTSFDSPGTDYTTDEDIALMLNTAPNYFLLQSKRNAETSWGAQASHAFPTSTLIAPQVQIGKYAYDVLADLGFGSSARHIWKSLRIRDFVYFEPKTLLGGEETNELPSAPSSVFINTVAVGAQTDAVDPLVFTTPALSISAIFEDDNALATGTEYDFEIATDNAFTTIIRTASFQPLGTSLADNDRSESINLPTDLPYNTDLYVRVRFYDNEGRISPSSSGVQFRVNDTDTPTLSAISPVNNSTGISVTSPVSFSLRDSGSAIDSSTIETSIGGAPALIGGVCQAGFTCTITAVAQGFDVSIEQTATFDNSDTISVEVEAKDFAGNTVTSSTSFMTENSVVFPSAPSSLFLNTSAAGAQTNAVDPLTFTSPALAISAIFEDTNPLETGTHYDYEIASDNGFTTLVSSATFQALGTSLDDDDRSESINLSTTLPFNTDLYVRIRFYDSEGRISPSSNSVKFRINDTDAPFMDSLSPADNSTNVPTSSPVDFALRDSGSAIDSTTIEASIAGVPAIVGGVCQTGFTCTITAVAQGYDVSIQRTAAFDENTTISVEIEAVDFAGNIFTSTTDFVTESTVVVTPPTPTQTTPNYQGSGGGFSTEPAKMPTRPSAPDATDGDTGNTGNTSDGNSGDTSRTPFDMFFPSNSSKTASKASLPPLHDTMGDSCDSMLAKYNYTIDTTSEKSFQDKIQFLERFGVNFSKSIPRSLQAEETVTRSELLKYLLQLTCTDFDKDVSSVPRFPDVGPSHPEDFYILLGRKYGLISGYLLTGRYEPDQFITHAEALKIAIGGIVSEGKPVDGKAELFSNVDYQQWYAPYVRFASDMAILREEQKFEPQAVARLSDIVEMLVQAVAVRR